MKPYFFVLGAPDHEMQEIARLCREHGLAYAFATTCGGSTVHSHEAYDATGIGGIIPPGSSIVLVECSVLGLPWDHRIDHHHPGDAGYGMPPEQYFEGSSLGQFLRFIGQTPTEQQLIIAAADHCLTSAYMGRCPGVCPQKLAKWRVESRCRARGLSPVELTRQIEEAATLLKSAPRIQLAGSEVAFLEEPPIEVSEASARLGMPYVYVRRHDEKQAKAGIRSAPPHLVREWLNKCGLERLYGDPQRGFAGGYFAA